MPTVRILGVDPGTVEAKMFRFPTRLLLIVLVLVMLLELMPLRDTKGADRKAERVVEAVVLAVVERNNANESLMVGLPLTTKRPVRSLIDLLIRILDHFQQRFRFP